MRCVVAIGIATALGCGDNVVGIPFERFDFEADRAECERLSRCQLVSSTDECLGSTRTISNLALERAVAEGIVRYDGPSAALCIEELAARSCDASSREARVATRACREAFIGTRKDGEVCAFDDECESQSCDIPQCGETCCFGTCRVRQTSAINGSCEVDVHCFGDAFCGKDLRCQPLVQEGGLCDDDKECDYGLGCIGPTELMPGNCRLLPALDEPCLYQRCADINAHCELGVCVAVGLPGSPCSKPSDCSPLARCDSSGQCVALPRLGEPCFGFCVGDSYCDEEETMTCLTLKPDGAPCGAGDECVSGFCKEGVAFDSCERRLVCY